MIMTAKEFLKDYRPDNKKKKKVLVQLLNHKGLITTACQVIGITRTTFYAWKKEDPEFKELVETINDLEVEHVRSKLSNLIDDGNPAGIIFYLKTKSSEFKPKLEVTGEDGGPVKVNAIFAEDLVKKSKKD